MSHEPDDGSRGDGAEQRDDEVTEAKDTKAQDVARMVFAFVDGAKTFAEGMDSSDEVRLLRLRTRKNEIVIVPGSSTFPPVKYNKLIYITDPKFLLVVIHDPPLA